VSNTPEFLSARCQSIYAGSGDAIDWTKDVRGNSQRLDRDADGLIEKLRRTRNLCRRLGAAAQRPLSVGVFGMSQAGKSYLISTLARAESGQLETVLDGNRLNFIGHINPPGGGKEATGLVTRFTRQKSEPPAGYPLELTLFSEADVVKILGNSFFNDFNRERVTFNTDASHIQQHLAALEKQRQPNPMGGLTEDDMVDLLDYFERRFEKSMAPLKADYWPTAIELAPRLAAAQRGKLLSILWGEIDDLTNSYIALRDAIEKLSNAKMVCVPLEALVVKVGSEFEWRPDSILNVDVLDRLGNDDSAPLKVLPVTDDEVLAETEISRSVLAALTAEMKFVLADPPMEKMLENVDLLDFPGYRGRLDIASIDEVRKEVKRDDADPVAQLLLRGKVAYLFERYTDDQEMNVLMMCTRCDTQIEVTTLAPALSSWVHSTQGETPETRAVRRPGLIWVITQMDRRLEAKPGQTVTQQQQEWSNMIHITLLERFSQGEWLSDWSGGVPFNNVFLVRKPGMLRSAYKMDDDGQELDFLNDDEKRRLSDQQDIFVDNEAVAKHVRDPGDAWDAVLSINDGGMTRLASYLKDVAVLSNKLDRIGEQVSRITEEIADHRLTPYFQAEGAGEVTKKQEIGERVAGAIEEYPDTFGELLYKLQPSAELLRRLYLRADDEPKRDAKDEGNDEPAARPARRSMISLPGKSSGEATESEHPAAISGRAGMFARAVISDWIRTLRELPENLDLIRFLDLPGEILQSLTDELVTASDRHRVEQKLIEVLRPLEEKRATTRIGIVDQQVLLATNVINEFVDYLGFADVPLDERPPSPADGRKVFEAAPIIDRSSLPSLPPTEVPYSGFFIVDWLEAFRKLAIGNAGHSAGREITPEQNQRLGEILELIRASESTSATV
jgi:hypothetical protein